VDSREAAPWKGTRLMSIVALEVKHSHPREWNSTSATRRTAAARGAARSGGPYYRSAAAKKPVRMVSVKTSVPGAF
jgi:hypothetical protein